MPGSTRLGSAGPCAAEVLLRAAVAAAAGLANAGGGHAPDDAFELCAGEQEYGDFDVILDAVIQEAILFENRTIDFGAVFV